MGSGSTDARRVLAGALARLQPVGAPARLQVAGQVMRRFGEDFTVAGTARVFSDPGAYRGQAAVEINKAAGNAAYSVALITAVPTRVGMNRTMMPSTMLNCAPSPHAWG